MDWILKCQENYIKDGIFVKKMVAQAKITLGPHEPRQLKKNIYFHAIKSGKNFFAFLGGKQKSFCMKLPKSCTWSWVVRVFIFIFPAEFKVSKRQALFSSSDTFSLNKNHVEKNIEN